MGTMALNVNTWIQKPMNHFDRTLGEFVLAAVIVAGGFALIATKTANEAVYTMMALVVGHFYGGRKSRGNDGR